MGRFGDTEHEVEGEMETPVSGWAVESMGQDEPQTEVLGERPREEGVRLDPGEPQHEVVHFLKVVCENILRNSWSTFHDQNYTKALLINESEGIILNKLPGLNGSFSHIR